MPVFTPGSLVAPASAATEVVESTLKTPDTIGIDLGSESVFFPLPTKATEAKAEAPTPPTQTNEGADSATSPEGVLLSASGTDAVLSIGTDGVAFIDPLRTTYISLPEATIISFLSVPGSADEASPTTSIQGTTGNTTPSNNEPQDSSSASYSYTGTAFIYSPLSPSSTHGHTEDGTTTTATNSPRPAVLAAGQLTITASSALSLSHAAIIADTTLSLGGEALTLPQTGSEGDVGAIISYASSGFVVVDASGNGNQLLSTVITQTSGKSTTEETSRQRPLPSVVEEPQPTDGTRSSDASDKASRYTVSSSSTEPSSGRPFPSVVEEPQPTDAESGSSSSSNVGGTSAAGAGSDLSSKAGKSAQQHGGAVLVIFTMVLFLI